MKRVLFIILILSIILTGSFSSTAFAQGQQEISVLIDGLPVAFDVYPVIQNGRTLVPFKPIAEALNVKVTWDGAAQTVNATDDKTSIRLQIGSKTAYRNETPITLDVPPQILNGRTLIPLRFFSEAFNCKVVWDNSIGQVLITSPPKQMAVIGFYALGDSKTSSWTNLFGKPYPEHSAGNTDVVGELALGWYSLDKDGNLLTKSRTGWQRPEDWEKVLETAKGYNLKTEMVVHVADGDGTVSSLLADETAMNKAVSSIADESKAYQGVNLDFEGLGYKDNGEQLKMVQDSFTRFVGLLSEKLKASGLDLTLTLHAPNSVYKGYDYKTLGEAADRIIIMAYDYGTKPEPVNLVRQAVEMAASAVPPEKLILGISAPSETPESIQTKVGIAKRYGLDGIAIWRLGLVPGEMWDALRTTVIPER
ncbi:MAG: stalk domain-containing protein [Thermoanaerobacteraceae bacterium]|nr:stalk domain-containing protein [Thermoanaerobacteraceae bacterium]